MAAYVAVAAGIIKTFDKCEITNINRSESSHADALATLASTIIGKGERTISVEHIPTSSISPKQQITLIGEEAPSPSWMDPFIKYHNTGELPEDKKEAVKIRRKATGFWLSPDMKLYKRSFTGPGALFQTLHLGSALHQNSYFGTKNKCSYYFLERAFDVSKSDLPNYWIDKQAFLIS